MRFFTDPSVFRIDLFKNEISQKQAHSKNLAMLQLTAPLSHYNYDQPRLFMFYQNERMSSIFNLSGRLVSFVSSIE